MLNTDLNTLNNEKRHQPKTPNTTKTGDILMVVGRPDPNSCAQCEIARGPTIFTVEGDECSSENCLEKKRNFWLM